MMFMYYLFENTEIGFLWFYFCNSNHLELVEVEVSTSSLLISLNTSFEGMNSSRSMKTLFTRTYLS